MTRGIVLGLTGAQIAARARYLGQLADGHVLDGYVNGGPVPVASKCPDGYYLLKEHNGGKDPTASDPFERWSKPGADFVNRTADCIGGAAWCGGFDRYQPKRFAHLYEGWINTDSMLLDAFGPAKCFVPIDRPEVGCFVVGMTGAKNFEGCGHIATVYAVPPEWDANVFDCWRHVLAVDVAHRDPNPANRPRDAGAWFAGRRRPGNETHYTAFVRSIMAP